MYMILWWKKDDYVVPILNKNNSIKLFNTIEEADDFANEHGYSDELRVISIDGVK